MIAKINSGNSFYSVALYNQKKVDAGKGSILYTQKLVGTSPKILDRTFENYNLSISQRSALHISLSFAAADKAQLSNTKLVDLSKTYLAQMGYEKQPYIIYRHTDTAHPHVHILTTRVDLETQKRINDSFERVHSKQITDKLERIHGLTISDNRQVIQLELVNHLEKVIQIERPENITQLNEALIKRQTPVRTEQTTKGLIYYKVGADGQRNSRPYKASYYQEAKLDFISLQSQFNSHIQDREYVEQGIQEALSKSPTTSINLFSEELQTKGIRTDFKVSSDVSIEMSYRYKEYLYQDTALATTAQKQLVFPTPEHYALREQLTRSIAANEPFELKYQNDYLTASTPDVALEKGLNQQSQSDLLALSKIHTTYQARYQQANSIDIRTAVLALASTDIDDTLQQKINQERKLKR